MLIVFRDFVTFWFCFFSPLVKQNLISITETIHATKKQPAEQLMKLRKLRKIVRPIAKLVFQSAGFPSCIMKLRETR